MKPSQWLSWVGGGGTRASTPSEGEPVRRVPVARILPNPFQPRRRFDPDSLAELAESIRQVGVLQPLLVRPRPEGGYELVAGERRLRAAEMAGLTEVPVVVRNLDDREAALIALVENLQREDLDFFEEAAAYQEMLSRFGLTQEQLAALLGKQQSTVANKLRLLRLPPTVRERIVAAGLSERHARALLRLESADEQEKVLEEVIARNLSVRETEELVTARLEGGRRPARRRRLSGL
ncbi:MAG TPA: ParB/RepB/Spo0J family partition protein, partial [Thermaerobacter sp.]